MGEDVTDMATTTSQLQAKLLALTGGKVDIMLDENTFKNSTQILREMAAAWEDMNDIQRASALELMGGKRQANVLSALIQNFDTVEDVIETSANSAGSALKENERYLDSIQGKIDQFNNAVQSMWNNFLDADAVKLIVEFGTRLIQLVDTLGLIPSILIAIGAFKGLQLLFNGADIIGFIKSINALTMGTKVFEAETRKAAMALIGEIINTKLASSALVEYAIKMGLATSSDVAKMTTTQLLALNFKALGTAIWGATKAVAAFLFTNPVGWIILAIGAIAGGVAIFDHFNKTVEELREELSGLKSELRSIQSEFESVNSELETTNSRMAELLAKDTLSFTEKEELENLKRTNAELERELYLLDQRKKRKQEDIENTFNALMTKESKNHTVSVMGSGAITETENLNWWISTYKTKLEEEEEARNDLIEAEKSEDKKKIKKAEKELKNAEKETQKAQKQIDKKIEQYTTAADGIDYDLADDDTKEYLDYIYSLEDKFNIISGDEKAKPIALSRIFNKKEYDTISDSIDNYVEALKNGDTSAKKSIENIINNNEKLTKDIKASGLSIDDAVNYFTSFASEANYSTIEGKVKEIDEATKRLNSALSNIDVSSIDSIKQALIDKSWIDSDGNLMSDAIAEYFGGEDGGISPETQKEIERLVQQIYDGKISVENALKQFEHFGIKSTIDIYISEVQTNFKDVFVELEDADGLIDTFKELGEAIGSTADALKVFNKAEAEMANSGRVSIETALSLMEYTDDYGSILEVVDGKLRLVDGAEEALIQTRIKAIKTSAEASLESAKAAYQEANDAVTTYQTALSTDKSAEVVASAWQKVLAAGSGLKAGIEALFSGGSWTDAYNDAYGSALSKMTGYETSYDDAGLQALINAREASKTVMDDAQDRVNLANKLTSETLESINNADDFDTKDEVADDRFQREMDYWENRIGANQAKYEQLQNEIDLLEKKGQKADASFYHHQMALENGRLRLLVDQKKAAEEYLATLKEGSEEWWEVANVLNDIESELDDVTASMVDLQDAIAEIDAYKFEEFNTRLDNLTSKLETIRDLIAPNGEEDWFDDEGNWTESGIAVLGSYLQELETYKQGYQNTMDELAKYELDYEGNQSYYDGLGIHSEQEWYDKTEELISQQYDFAQSISDTEQSVVDMYENSIDAVEEYMETLIDGYNDYIDSVKEALDAERDLYDFKKNVEKQAKDISELERRISSLSGSTNAADIAERRKLEAQLYESRESLNDTYYDHAKDAQQDALDAEASAYEETMTKMVEGMRTSLEEATVNMETFLSKVTIAVSMNAEDVLAKYRETQAPLDDYLTNPWENAKTAVGEYGDNANNLMDVWKNDGYFAEFQSEAGTNLSSPWKNGETAATSFTETVGRNMNAVVSSIESNVTKASGSLTKLYQQIQDTAAKAASVNVDLGSGSDSGGGGGSGYAAPTPTGEGVMALQEILKNVYYKSVPVNGIWDSATSAALSTVQRTIGVNQTGEYDRDTAHALYNNIGTRIKQSRDNGYTSDAKLYEKYRKKIPEAFHAKGTLGTKRDEWAITDESQFGDELVLVPGKDGNLSFMRKGTGVVPADMTEKLWELAQIPTSDLMRKNITAIVPDITKNDIKNEFNFDSLVHVDHCDQNTLKDLEKMVDTKINDFSKQMNYSLKRFAR
jgi:peptidoglycan hydrolase-like protein with peptidoglycan-binding domain